MPPLPSATVGMVYEINWKLSFSALFTVMHFMSAIAWSINKKNIEFYVSKVTRCEQKSKTSLMKPCRKGCSHQCIVCSKKNPTSATCAKLVALKRQDIAQLTRRRWAKNCPLLLLKVYLMCTVADMFSWSQSVPGVKGKKKHLLVH